MGYATRTGRPPRTLTEYEQARLLKVSGEHVEGFRDHMIFSLALGTGLRESEIVGLDVEDVTADGVKPRRSLQLRVFKRGSGKADPSAQRVTLPDGTYYKLEKYLRNLPPGATGPLFVSRGGGVGGKAGARLSSRRVRSLFKTWQERAHFDHVYTFHELRHTAVTNVYRQTHDVRVAQRFARHASLTTTTVYAHVSDEDLARAVKKLAS